MRKFIRLINRMSNSVIRMEEIYHLYYGINQDGLVSEFIFKRIRNFNEQILQVENKLRNEGQIKMGNINTDLHNGTNGPHKERDNMDVFEKLIHITFNSVTRMELIHGQLYSIDNWDVRHDGQVSEPILRTIKHLSEQIKQIKHSLWNSGAIQNGLTPLW